MRDVAELFSKDELRQLTQRSDARAWLAVAVSWTMIAAAFALVGYDANALTIAIALVVIGGRQLGLAVLMHETVHNSLFRTKWLNELVGRWLFAAPCWLNWAGYQRHHIAHHVHTGTERDPDLSLVTPFPATRRSMMRKLARDISGLTGLKRVVGLLMMDFGYIRYTASPEAVRIERRSRSLLGTLGTGLLNMTPTVVANVALWGVLYTLGHGWLYLLWVASYLTTFSLFLRIRSIAEHACTALCDDQLKNTRTTRAGWLARLTVAPHYVNYHLEHHLLMGAPCYRLGDMHRMLRERGVLDGSNTAPSYMAVLRRAAAA